MYTSGEVMADWSSLPGDLIGLIADKLPVIDDLDDLKAMCRSYRSALENKKWRLEGGSSQPPWLLLCCHAGDDDNNNNNPQPQPSPRGFLNMYRTNKFVMDLPELHGRRCWGSPYGWVLTLGLDRKIHLFNPLNRRRILLPQTVWKNDWDCDENEKSHWMRHMQIDRAIFIKRPPGSYSSSPFDDFLIVTTSCSYELHVIRPHSWEPVKLYCKDPKLSRVGRVSNEYVLGGLIELFDVAIYNDQIYVLAAHGMLFKCSNFDGPDPPTAIEYAPMDEEAVESTDKAYLVESLGELWMVVRTYLYDDDCDPYYNTVCFEVYKFNHATKKWIELENLQGCAIFVGGGCQTIALSQPEDVGCRRNCIYFTDDNYEQFVSTNGGGHDMGIYDYDKLTFQPLYDGDGARSIYSSPTWLFPSFT